MKIAYVGVPAEVKREVAEILRHYRSAVPGWMNRLVIQYDHDYTGENSRTAAQRRYGPETKRTCIAWIEVRYEYRYAVLTIFGKWTDPIVERERTIVHELAHCHASPLDSFAGNLLDRRDEANEMQRDAVLEALYEQYRVALESSVEDIAHAIMAVRAA